ncbi:hypothetical protein RUM43_012299 [Polyplax serrata]|uniref:Uncharacterized protein n=1 Tax=Polyplax serrata TaxID=468196 RepID=A0AAN8S087_POLSC
MGRCLGLWQILMTWAEPGRVLVQKARKSLVSSVGNVLARLAHAEDQALRKPSSRYLRDADLQKYHRCATLLGQCRPYLCTDCIDSFSEVLHPREPGLPVVRLLLVDFKLRWVLWGCGSGDAWGKALLHPQPTFIFGDSAVLHTKYTLPSTPTCLCLFINLGVVTSVEVNHKPIESARKGMEVCIKIENVPGETPKLYGRHFDHTDLLTSKEEEVSFMLCFHSVERFCFSSGNEVTSNKMAGEQGMKPNMEETGSSPGYPIDDFHGPRTENMVPHCQKLSVAIVTDLWVFIPTMRGAQPYHRQKNGE